MTVENLPIRVFYNGDDLVTTFPITFSFDEADDVYVTQIAADDTETPWVQGGPGATGYTVSGTDVVANTAPATGTQLVIYRITDLTQENDYVENRAIPANTREQAEDKLTLIVQEQGDAIERSMIIPVTSALGVSTELPIPSPLKYFRWNEDADAMEAVTAEEIAGAVLASNFVVDTYVDGVDFTAGVTTELVLTSVPGTENNTQIYFDGAYVEKGDYTLDGSTITFAAPIPGGTGVVEVMFILGAAPSVPADGSVIAVKIATDAVTTPKILDDAVTADKILADAVTTVKILDDAVTEDKILADAVTTAKILDDAVTAAKIVAGAAIKAGGVALNYKEIDIGDWNMNTTVSVDVAHGLDYTKIRPPMQAFIIDDAETMMIPLDGPAASPAQESWGRVAQIDATNIKLNRTTSGGFDGAGYATTPFNRGYIGFFYKD